jgi:hypothetical protein
MYLFAGITFALFVGLAFSLALVNREEISKNWNKYRYDPLYMFAAPLFKPNDDPRSRTQFGIDNFKDGVSQNINNVFLKFLQPVFGIFKIFMDAMNQTLGGLFNIRMLVGKYWNAFNRMTDVFMRRFNSTFHQLRMTFTHLNHAFKRITGLTTSAVYAGLSTISTMTSFLDLMMKVIITILVILVVMVILLFFVLWPFIPVILSVVAIISATAMGGAVGGMSSTFCFGKDTRVQTKDRGAILIGEIRNGDILANGAVVQGTMVFNTPSDDLYNVHGVTVSGSHILYIAGEPAFVHDYEQARPIPRTSESVLHCLITSTHRIPVVAPTLTEHVLEFADWEEISDTDDLKHWHTQVFDTLNLNAGAGGVPEPSADILHSEAVVSGRTKIWTTLGPVEIRGIHPGDVVLDEHGKPTVVTGVVCIDESQVRAAAHLGGDAWISAAAWISNDAKTWNHPEHTIRADGIHEWYSLFTESGTFRLCEVGALGLHMRDFTDIGADHIHETYEWVLDSLEAAADAVDKTDN